MGEDRQRDDADHLQHDAAESVDDRLAGQRKDRSAEGRPFAVVAAGRRGRGYTVAEYTNARALRGLLPGVPSTNSRCHHSTDRSDQINSR